MTAKRLRTAMLALLLPGSCASFAQGLPLSGRPPAVLSFDMPYGGCRMVLNADGSASLSYGAVPAFVDVPAGTFDALAVKAAFESQIPLSRQRAQGSEPVGHLRIAGAPADLWFSDAAFAQSLFDRALQHRLPSAEPSTSGPRSVVLGGCARRDRAAPGKDAAPPMAAPSTPSP